ncbi:MAG: hypothetical protein ACPF9D_09600, partial [Owenweeksia sp.]
MKILTFALCFLTLLSCSRKKTVVPEAHPIQQMSDSAFTQYLQALTDSLGTEWHADFEGELSADAYLADLHILKRVLEEAQTSLYRYSSKKETDSVFHESFMKANESVRYLDLIKSMASIQNIIACGHSGWGHHPGYFAYRDSAVHLFPFDLKVMQSEWYIKRNNSLDTNIPDYARITHINRQPVDSIAKQLRKFMYRDGNSASQTGFDLESSF